jgi:hypothetical protein
MEATEGIDLTENGASSQSVEQAGASALKPETIARRTRRRRQRLRELAAEKAALEAMSETEAERIANAETQGDEPELSTPVPVVRRPTQVPHFPAPARRSTSSTTNPAEDAGNIFHPDEYPSQVPPTQENEMMGESPPLQRTRDASGVTATDVAHNLFNESQIDYTVCISTQTS